MEVMEDAELKTSPGGTNLTAALTIVPIEELMSENVRFARHTVSSGREPRLRQSNP